MTNLGVGSHRWIVAILCGAGCSGSSTAPMRCPIGDSSQPAQLTVVDLDANYTVEPTHDGGQVMLHVPAQGGYIALLGARATNIDGCTLTITTSFRAVSGGPIIGIDERPAQLDATGDGWGTTNDDSFGNLPICPQDMAPQNLDNTAWEVTVALDDLDGKTASQTLELTPICPSDDLVLCPCKCDRDYMAGDMCPLGP